MPLISIIIPTHNRSHLLPRAIDSVRTQTCNDYELIVVDDASIDNTQALVQSLQTTIPIHYERLDQHSGVSKARNLGVSLAKGEWIAFLDSDDTWHKQKLQKQLAWHKQNESFAISQTKEVWIRNGIRVNPPATHEKKPGDIFKESLLRCMITPSSVMMRKDLFMASGGFNESLPACEDYDLWLRLCCRLPIGLVNEYLVTRYGGHDDQLSSTVMGLDRFRIRSMLDLLQSGILSKEQEMLTKNQLIIKAHIVANGYLKRGNLALHEQFKRIAEQF